MVPLNIATLTNARKPGFSALISPDVKTPTGNSADYKQAAADDLGRMGLIIIIMARTQGIFYGPATGRGSGRTTIAVAAEANGDTARFLRMVVGCRPLSGRLSGTQRVMLNPMVREATQELVAVEDSAMARYATDSSPSAIEPEQRRTASDKRAYHRNLREALRKISESPEDFIMYSVVACGLCCALEGFVTLVWYDVGVMQTPRTLAPTSK